MSAESLSIKSLTILPGTDKDGVKETFEKIDVHKGEVIALVGATGSGKSRFLGDIEWFSSGDSPTKRKILINGKTTNSDISFNTASLIGKLSQNMNFFIDLSVSEFLNLHAESVKKSISSKMVQSIVNQANKLVGEPFSSSSHLTEFSGGQARALMIADIIFISNSPIILIDEIENVGINKVEALKLMLLGDKITFISTHDPLIALLAHRRLVLRNGAVYKILQTTKQERHVLKKLIQKENESSNLQLLMRTGERIQL